MHRAMKPPQTEDEEHAALAYEAGWLSRRVVDLTGHLPRAIAKAVESDGGFDLRAMPSEEIAQLCDAIRAECPDAGEPF